MTVAILMDNGFLKEGKQWYSPEYDLLVEFVSGNVPSKINSLNYHGHIVYITSLEDIVIDRLCAAKWWKCDKDFEWAVVMLSSNTETASVDVEYLRNKAVEEDVLDFLDAALDKIRELGCGAKTESSGVDDDYEHNRI